MTRYIIPEHRTIGQISHNTANPNYVTLLDDRANAGRHQLVRGPSSTWALLLRMKNVDYMPGAEGTAV